MDSNNISRQTARRTRRNSRTGRTESGIGFMQQTTTDERISFGQNYIHRTTVQNYQIRLNITQIFNQFGAFIVGCFSA